MKRTKNTLIIRNIKGFTIAELLVVLVVLGILMAVILPSLMGFTDKAKETNGIIECRTCLEAAQTISNEKYAVNSELTVDDAADVLKLADLTDICSILALKTGGTKDATIQLLYILASDGSIVKYKNGEYSTESGDVTTVVTETASELIKNLMNGTSIDASLKSEWDKFWTTAKINKGTSGIDSNSIKASNINGIGIKLVNYLKNEGVVTSGSTWRIGRDKNGIYLYVHEGSVSTKGETVSVKKYIYDKLGNLTSTETGTVTVNLYNTYYYLDSSTYKKST